MAKGKKIIKNDETIWKSTWTKNSVQPKAGVTFNATEEISKRKSKFFKKMPERERGKGTFGGGVSRP